MVSEKVLVPGMFFAGFCILAVMAWFFIKSIHLEKTLLNELDEIAELDTELCPFDGHLTKTSSVILFDFSDPLPVELNDYPTELLDNFMGEIQGADRFDRFSLYTLNPYGETPKDINAFCVPITINQIPRDIRKKLWGKDPQQHTKLPPRYHRFADVLEHLWENENELSESMNESINTLASEARKQQSYSRIIENIEEIAGMEIDRDSRKIKVVIFSNMLQNSPRYSHYGNSWEFEEYLSKRPHEILNMERFAFEIYFVQSCQSLVTKNRRALQKFWEDYFGSSNASVKFKLLRIDGGSCNIKNPAKKLMADLTTGAETSQDNNVDEEFSEPGNNTTKPAKVAEKKTEHENSAGRDGAAPAAKVETFDEKNIDKEDDGHEKSETLTGAEFPGDKNIEDTFSQQSNETTTSEQTTLAMLDKDKSIGHDVISTPVKKDCPAPKLRKMPALTYPKRARGDAVLRYKINLDAQGTPVGHELYDIDIGSGRYEKMFRQSAEKYIQQLHYKVQIDDSCIGGLTTQLAIRFD